MTPGESRLISAVQTGRAYYELYHRVWSHGQQVDSRFGATHELLNQQFRCTPGDVLDRAGMNLRIGWVDVVQLMAGIFDHDAYVRYAPRSGLSLFTEAMAYGPRAAAGIQRVLHILEH